MNYVQEIACVEESTMSKVKPKGFTQDFKVITLSRQYYLYTDCLKDKERWVNAFKAILKIKSNYIPLIHRQN